MFDFEPTETQTLIRDTARGFAERVLAPQATKLDREGGFPVESLAQAAELGLLGIAVPEELGGVEAGPVAYALAVFELARVCAATTVAMTVSNMVAEVVAAFGNEEQRSLHVPKLCGGDYVVGGFALSEPQAGSDPGAMLTRARRTDRGWVLSGSKLWITSGTHAELFVVWARTNDAAGPAGISAFLVPGSAPGVIRGRAEEKLGQHGSTTTALDFEDVELPESALLGEEGKGFRVAMMALDGGRIGIAALATGVATAALDAAVAYAKERKTFGKPLIEHQAVGWMLADSARDVEAARNLTLRAAWLKESKRSFTREASHAKLWASERGFQVCNRAIQVLGGFGYTKDFPVERYLRDVRVTSIYEGTSEIQRIVIARDVARRFGGV